MSLYAYEIFDAVVKEASFLKAAERLNLSPSAISHSVARLEERFQTKLFNRNRSRVELTAAGEHLLPYIRSILREESRLVQEADFLHGDAQGTVRIGTPGSVCRAWLPGILNDFQKSYPGITVIVLEGSLDIVMEQIRLQSLDLIFIPEKLITDKPHTRLHKDRLICAAPPDFVPNNGSSVTAEDLYSNTVINCFGRNNADAETFLKNNHISIKSSFHVDDVDTMLVMIESGFGIGLTTESSVAGTRRNVRVLPLMPETYRIISLFDVDPDFQTRAVQVFRDFALEHLKASGKAELLQ